MEQFEKLNAKAERFVNSISPKFSQYELLRLEYELQDCGEFLFLKAVIPRRVTSDGVKQLLHGIKNSLLRPDNPWYRTGKWICVAELDGTITDSAGPNW